MKNSNERIICSAIHYDDGKQYLHQPKNIKYGFVVSGLRHGNCIMTCVILTGFNKQIERKIEIEIIDEIQGFITNEHRFVDRIEAMNIAIKENQVKESDLINPRVGLFSEDLY